MRYATAVLMLALLPSCGEQTDPGPVTKDESRALNDAAEMLDEHSYAPSPVIDNASTTSAHAQANP